MVRAILMTLLVLASLLGAREAAAQTCTATAPDVYFGNVPIPVPATSTTAQVSVSCSGPANDTLRLCIGIQPLSGAWQMRLNPSSSLAYRIYSNSSHSMLWDDSEFGQVLVLVPLDGTGTGNETLDLYAHMPAGGSPANGLYNAGGVRVVGRIKSGQSGCNSGNSNGTFNGDTFNASVFVGGNCVISTDPLLNFGAVTGVIATDVDAAIGLQANCNNQLPYTIALNGGLHEDAGGRRLSDGAEFVDYRLYRDAGRAQLWGDGSPDPVYSGTGTGAQQTLTVYGRVPGGQAVGSGTYTDTVIATITY